MIHEFTTKDMSDLLYNDLSTIQDNEGVNTETVLTTPTTESTFPCRVVDTPLESVNNTNNATPIRKTFQVSIEHWDNRQRICMEMANNTDKKLQTRNFETSSNSFVISVF